MKKTNHKFQRAMASLLAFIMIMLSTSLLTTISVLAADGDITYLAPVYDAEGNITFDGAGNVVMAEQTLTDGTYNVVTTSTTVMGTTDTAAVADANGEYWYVVNENVTMPTAITGITVTGKIHLILCDGAALDMSFDTLTVSEGNELTIYGQENGTGTLKANTNNAGSSTGAGIGGNVNSPNAGKITINGGMVSARGATNSGAGIGGGKGGNGGEITINGGAVTATGGTYYGAGIGGSGGGSGGNITINGGQVVANSGSEAAAIGGSSSGSLHGSSGNIIINGGTVTAMTNSGSYSCGIGTGKAGKLDSVTINGGIITAIGSTAAAIGTANYSGTDNGTIAINGGKVTATVTGGSAPAIGNNKTGTVDVTITGGYVEAVGGTASAGIGGGQNANSGQITISGGTVIARAGTCTTGSQFSAAGIGGGGSTSSSKDGGIGYVTITGGYIEAYSSGAYANTGGAGIGGGRMNHGVISIGGGCIIAEGGPDADGIGGGAGRDLNTQFVQVEFTGSIGGSSGGSTGGSASGSTGTTPDIGSDPEDSQIQSSGAIIFTTSIPDMSEAAIANYTGIICIKYGNTLAYSPSEYVFTENFTIPADYTLQIDSGESLTVANGAILTAKGAIVNNGTLTLKKGSTLTGEGSVLATKSDHSFKGWYRDAGLALPFDSFNTPVEQDTTLYPKFEVGASTIEVEIQGVTTVTSSNFLDMPGKQTYSGTPKVYVTDEFGTRFVSLDYEANYFLLELDGDGEVISRTPITQSVRWTPGTYETVITVIDRENDGFHYQGELSWRTVVGKCNLSITPKSQIYGVDGSVADNLFSYSPTIYVAQNSIITATVTEENGTLYTSDAKVVDCNGIDITECYNFTYSTITATQATVEEIEASTRFNVAVNSIYVPYEKLIRKEAVSIDVKVNNAYKCLGSDFEISIITEGLKGIYIEGNSLVVTPEFTQNTSDSATPFKKSVSISVTYTNGEFSKTATKAVTINWEEPTATRVAICKNGNEITSDSLDITEGATATYTAKVLDQYGYEISGQTIVWADSELDGVTMQNGVLMAESSTESKNGMFTVTSGELSARLPIEFVGDVEQEHTCDHSVSMRCSDCGELAPLKFYGWSLTLQDNIALNYAVDAKFFADGCYTDPSVTFTIGERTVTVTEYNTTKYAGYYIFTLTDIAPHQMGMTVSATLSATDDETPVTTDVAEYSIKTYCYNKLNDKNTSDELKMLIVDLLNYGAATQTYVGSTDPLVNADLTEGQKAFGTQEDATLETVAKSNYQTVENATVTWAGAYLTLTDAVEMKFVFNADTTEGLTVKITTADPAAPESVGNTWTITEFAPYAEGVYIANFDGFNADQMSDVVYVTVCDSEGNTISNTYRYSIESYAYAKSNDANSNLAVLVKAMMKYGNSAKNYNS